MKNYSLSTFISALLTFSAVACASADNRDVNNGLKLAIELKEKIHVSLTNESNKDKYVMLPLNVTIDDSGSGVEYKITDLLNNKYNLCSNINPLRAMEVERLSGGDRVERDYTLGVIAKMYCLNSGSYRMQAIYHNVINRDNKLSVPSNIIEIYVPPKAVGERGQLVP